MYVEGAYDEIGVELHHLPQRDDGAAEQWGGERKRRRGKGEGKATRACATCDAYLIHVDEGEYERLLRAAGVLEDAARRGTAQPEFISVGATMGNREERTGPPSSFLR